MSLITETHMVELETCFSNLSSDFHVHIVIGFTLKVMQQAPIGRATYVSLLEFSLLASFSGAVGCSLIILCFTSSIFLRASFNPDIVMIRIHYYTYHCLRSLILFENI
ncbi:hypothetical protein STEG23_010710, partial [Scotinomys teguina]